MTALTLDEVIAAESKDALLEWVKAKHGVTLNGAYRFETLIEKARALEGAGTRAAQAVVDTPNAERWLLNPKTGNRFPWTAMLAARGDLVPCDPPAEAETP
jgi:hypothetical protein